MALRELEALVADQVVDLDVAAAMSAGAAIEHGLCDLLLELSDLLLQSRCCDLDAQDASIGLVDRQRVVREVIAELDRLSACELRQ